MKKDKRIEREQGDVNTTENRRKYWQRNLSGPAKKWFDADPEYFLHQSLSTPVLNVLTRAQGKYIEDIDGKKYIDMHGNGVHNAGFNNPAVIEGNILTLRPALVITRDEMDRAIDIIDEAICEVEQGKMY